MKVRSQWDIDTTAYEAGTMLIIQYENGTIKFKMSDNIHKFNDLSFYGDDQLNLKISNFATSTQYTTNDIVMYNGDIYIAKIGFTSGASFDIINWKRAGTYYTATETDTKLTDYVAKTSVNNDIILSFTPSATNTIFKISLNKKNLSTGVTSTEDVELPAATSLVRGVATPEMVTAIGQHESRLSQLEGSSSRYIVNIGTYAADTNNPTQTELTNAYKGVSGSSVDPKDGTILISEQNNSIQWQYVTSSTTWILTNGAVPIFSKNAGGIIVGADEAAVVDKGKITAGIDGKGTVNKLSEIISEKIAVDIENLTLKNQGEQTIIPLVNKPYKITSIYGSIECYGKLFIFDQQTVGKGIIRNSATNTFSEVTDLGIYAPSGTINAIHIIDKNDKSICYLINDKAQTKTLVIYPDGTYKVCEMGNLNRTPQLINNMRLLTSMDGKRHSLFMYNSHSLETTTNATITEYLLFQLEDAQLRILDASSPECSGYPSAGTFNPSLNFLNCWFAFEDEETIPDYESEARNDINLFQGYTYKDTGGNNKFANKRLPYKTGIWQTASGSPMIDRLKREQHNGIFGHTRGAMILFPYDTNVQYILITPEGFIGWFQGNTQTYEYYRDYRFSEIKSGPYAGKRGIFFYTISTGYNQQTFIVNTPDGDPLKTVCTSLKTDLTNLNHLNGKYPMANASAVFYPSNIYTDYHRIHINIYITAITSSSRVYHYYINQKDIKANSYTVTDNKYILGNRLFDICCLDCRIDTNYSSATWHPDSWCYMDRFDWAINPQKETKNVATVYRGNRIKELVFLTNTVSTKSLGVKIGNINTKLVIYVKSNGAIFLYTGDTGDYTDANIEDSNAVKIFDGTNWSSAINEYDFGNGVNIWWDNTTNKFIFSTPLTVYDSSIKIRESTTLDSSFVVTLVSYENVDPKAMSGTLVHGKDYSCSLFIPDAEETWDGSFGVRPYFIQHEDNESTSIDGYSFSNLEYRKHYWRTAVWNHQFFMGFLNGTTGVAFIRSYYFDTTTARFMSRKVKFASAGCEMAPVIIDDRVMLLMPNNSALNRCIGLVRNDNTEIGYTITDGGNFLFPYTYSKGPIFQRPPTTGELTATPGITGITYIFDQITSRSTYLRFSYIDNNDGTISQPTIQSSTSFWTENQLPASFIVKYMFVMPNGRLLLITNASTNKAYSIPPGLTGSEITLFNESNTIGYVFDITNTKNENESEFGCYVIVPQGQSSYFYTLEYNETDITPVSTKWYKRATSNSRIWALPYGNENDVQVQRFLLGSSTYEASAASNPGTIIERIGGKININNQNPLVYTRVRDFGTSWNPTSGSSTARADLAVPARKWYNPHLVSFDKSVVRFLPKKTLTLGDTYTQVQNTMLLGYNYDSSGNPTPFYGLFDKNQENYSNYHTELEYPDNYIVEIGLTPNRDSMIYTGQDYGFAMKLAEGWRAHLSDQPVEFSVGSKYGNGNTATIWGSYGNNNNYCFRGLLYLTIENVIVGTSPITGHVEGQFTHEWISNPYITSSALAGFGPASSYGWSGFEPIIKEGKIAFRDHTLNVNVANWSSNEGLSIINPNINLPYAALTSAQYTIGRGNPINTFFETTARTPLFQVLDNQILPGIYRRRNNQDLNPNSTNGIVPYFQFTNEKCDMIYKDITNTPWVDANAPKPFYDEVRMSNVTEEHYNVGNFKWRYKTKEAYNASTGNTVILCYYTENGVSKYKEITLPDADEFMTRLTYLNGYMVTAGVSKIYKINVVNGAVTKELELPDALSVISFNMGTDLYTFHSNDDSNLYEFSKKSLVLDYNGNSYYVIPLSDLNIVGNNNIENLAVTNQLVSSYGRIATLEVDKIHLKSEYQSVIFP
jgi:hypothetical protein